MFHKVLHLKLFVPPNFLQMPAVSVEVDSRGLSFLSVKNTDKGLLPDVYGFVPLPEGTISQNEIIKKELIVKALIDIRKKTKRKFVRFSIPEEKTYIFKTHLPNLKPKEIYEVLDFKIEENVPLTAKEAIFDYDIVANPKKILGLDMVVSVTPLNIVEEWQDLFETAGLTPILFSPESNNVAKAVIKKSNQQIIVIVNIRESSIVLSLVVYGIVYQTSSLNFGASTFTDLLAKYLSVSLEEAEKMKTEKLYSENEFNAEILSYFVNTTSLIKDEIYKFISYCNEREDVDGQVDRVILCGKDAMIIGLDKYLSFNLNIKVDIANIWINNFDLDAYTPEISKIDSEDLAVVNGLCLF